LEREHASMGELTQVRAAFELVLSEKARTRAGGYRYVTEKVDSYDSGRVAQRGRRVAGVSRGYAFFRGIFDRAASGQRPSNPKWRSFQAQASRRRAPQGTVRNKRSSPDNRIEQTTRKRKHVQDTRSEIHRARGQALPDRCPADRKKASGGTIRDPTAE